MPFFVFLFLFRNKFYNPAFIPCKKGARKWPWGGMEMKKIIEVP